MKRDFFSFVVFYFELISWNIDLGYYGGGWVEAYVFEQQNPRRYTEYPLLLIGQLECSRGVDSVQGGWEGSQSQNPVWVSCSALVCPAWALPYPS